MTDGAGRMVQDGWCHLQDGWTDGATGWTDGATHHPLTRTCCKATAAGAGGCIQGAAMSLLPGVGALGGSIVGCLAGVLSTAVQIGLEHAVREPKFLRS